MPASAEEVERLKARIARLEVLVRQLQSALDGGTTGQTLTKASGDPLDFQWVT